MQFSRLDYYLASGYSHAQIFDANNKNVTAQIFKILKRKKSLLLQYFSIHYDEKAKEFIKATIPPAFEGHILSQMRDVINEE